MFAARCNILVTLLVPVVLLLLWSIGSYHPVLSAPNSTTVPSQVPTEAPGEPIRLGVPSTQLTVSGCASPNALVQFFDNNSPVGTVIADGSGQFTKIITVDNALAGLHNIKTFYDDNNGRTSSIVSTNISLAPQTNTSLNLLLPTTVEHAPEPVRAGMYLIFRGTTCPYSVVNVIINNNFTLAAQADSRGNWYVIADTEGYYIGGHIYEVLSSKNSQISENSTKYSFTIVGRHDADVNEDIPSLTPPTIVEPRDPHLSSTRNVTFRGTAPTNTQVEIYIDNVLKGSVFTNPIGEWSFQLNMLQPQHSVVARACYLDNCSDFSNRVRVRYAGEFKDCELDYSLSNYRFYGLKSGDGVDLSIASFESGNPNYEVLIDWGDAAVESITLTNDNSVKLHHVFKMEGQFNGSVTIKDDSGCSQTQFFSVYIGPIKPINWWWLLMIPLGGFLTYGVSQLITIYRTQPDPLGKSKLPLPHPKPKSVYADTNPDLALSPKNPSYKKGWYKD